jgi:RNA polymerase sigma factor for flagellar operon FliA
VFYVYKRSFGRRRLPCCLDGDDLVSAGDRGLIISVDRFDFERGVDFSTFAVPRIWGEMMSEIRGLRWKSRTGINRMRDIERLENSAEKQGRIPTYEDYANAMDLRGADRKRVGWEIQCARSSVSGHIKSLILDDVKGAPPAAKYRLDIDPIQEAMRRERKEELERWVQKVQKELLGLPKREAMVVYWRYFLGREQKELTSVFGVGASRVSQIHKRAMTRLGSVMVGSGDRRTSP